MFQFARPALAAHWSAVTPVSVRMVAISVSNSNALLNCMPERLTAITSGAIPESGPHRYLRHLDGTERHRRFYLAVLIRRPAQKKLAHMKLLDPHIWSVGNDLSVSRAVQTGAFGLRAYEAGSVRSARTAALIIATISTSASLS